MKKFNDYVREQLNKENFKANRLVPVNVELEESNKETTCYRVIFTSIAKSQYAALGILELTFIFDTKEQAIEARKTLLDFTITHKDNLSEYFTWKQISEDGGKIPTSMDLDLFGNEVELTTDEIEELGFSEVLISAIDK